MRNLAEQSRTIESEEQSANNKYGLPEDYGRFPSAVWQRTAYRETVRPHELMGRSLDRSKGKT